MTLERRIGPEDRRAPPVPLPECAIDWAQHMIESFHRTHREVADQLGINRRTLDRRLQHRKGPELLLIRCWCGAPTRASVCPRGHPIDTFRAASR